MFSAINIKYTVYLNIILLSAWFLVDFPKRSLHPNSSCISCPPNLRCMFSPVGIMKFLITQCPKLLTSFILLKVNR